VHARRDRRHFASAMPDSAGELTAGRVLCADKHHTLDAPVTLRHQGFQLGVVQRQVGAPTVTSERVRRASPACSRTFR
jgi:hypothetical protein